MLSEFLISNRAELINRCQSMVAQRLAPRATGREIEHGIPLFLDQLITILQAEQSPPTTTTSRVSGPADGGDQVDAELGATAALHGRELLKQGYSVDQVVHDYGDLCQAITGLASEKNSPIDIEEFRTLNRCLDDGIADAVTEYAHQRESLGPDDRVQAFNDRLGCFSHDLRNLVHTATLAFASIRAGNVGPNGATAAVLDKSLIGLRRLIDRSLADVRLAAGLPPRHQVVSVAEFIKHVEAFASLEARQRGVRFRVATVDPELMIDADNDMLFSAVGNLLQNAFKFTKLHTEVSLNAYARADRIVIDVTDRCGGLPLGATEKMFVPFTQSGSDKSGLGLGLTICRRSVEANNGVLQVRDIPGSGCVFSIELPRHTP